MRQWILMPLLAAMVSGQVFMVVQYDTQQNVPVLAFNFSMKVVELKATVLGCDDGYYENPATTIIECIECACDIFNTGREERFIDAS